MVGTHQQNQSERMEVEWSGNRDANGDGNRGGNDGGGNVALDTALTGKQRP